jgi:GR25 family glycosyltransferase involved in LPS biosynthesis
MPQLANPAVLIIAYRRKVEIERILQECKENSIDKIYVALDGPKDESMGGKKDYLAIKEIVTNFQENFAGVVKTLYRNQNVGCAASCLSACDWAFENEKYVIVLEDDCIPSRDFFKFARSSIYTIDYDPNVWLACGTQFAPSNIQNDSWILSSYALIWGWVTNQVKWREMSSAIRSGNPIPKKNGISPWERVYWNQGSRRAYSGWKDVWDTILLQQMIANKKFAILPSEPLVTNVGDDSSATHTIGESSWLHLKMGQFTTPKKSPEIATSNDKWLRSNFYRIAPRHLVTTRITHFKDLLNAKNTPLSPLFRRWNFANSTIKNV